MSKEGLEALDSLRCAVSLCPNHDYKKENELCDIIEKELKEGQNFKDEYYKLVDTYTKDINAQNEEIISLRKKEKALEIIINKGINVSELKSAFEIFDTYKKYIEYYNTYCLTQEEYDLLKEELEK